MLAESNPNMQEATATVYKLSQEEKIRQQCEAREDYYRRTVGREQRLKELSSENDQLSIKLKNLSSKNEKLASDVENLSSKNEKLASDVENLSSKNEKLASDVENLSSKNEKLVSEIERLRKLLKDGGMNNYDF